MVKEAPLAPAIHLGARRLLAISIRYSVGDRPDPGPDAVAYPPPAQVLGMLMNAIFLDAMDAVADLQFSMVQRQDITVSFVEPVSSRARHEIGSLPGVMTVEPFRAVPARLRHGHRYRNLSIMGMPMGADLSRIVELSGNLPELPPDGLLISKILGKVLHIEPGDTVVLEVLEGARPVREAVVSGLVDDTMGITAWMEIGALHRLMREGGSLSGAHILVDHAQLRTLYRQLKALPAVAGVAITSAARESFDEIMAQNLELMTAFNVLFAAIISFGVVYNSARISLSERSRELASLRVLGFTIAEISLILLGELAIVPLLAIPPGLVVGWLLSSWILMTFESEVYRIPLVITTPNVAWSLLTVLAASLISALVVRRKLDKLDLVAVLKTRE